VELRKSFRVALSRDEAVERLDSDETLISLLPGNTEIVDSSGDRRTTRTRYSALGREGVATFHFTFLLDGNVRFEKVCDGNVWRRLVGSVVVDEDGDSSVVTIEMEGRTKTLVPELAIKGPLEDQMQTMVDALRGLLDA
jgi:hypothetical protein